MNSKFPLQGSALLITSLLAIGQAQAVTMCGDVGDAIRPNFSDVKLTGFQTITTYNGSNAIATDLSATACAGLYVGNDQPQPQKNDGSRFDGLLNGANQTGGQTDPDLSPNTAFSPGAFITEADLHDLDGIDQLNDGNLADDPGWIQLFKTGDGYRNAFGFDIADLLTIEISCTNGSIGSSCTQGSWSLTPVVDIVEQLAAALGDGFFDHLAIGFKGGNVTDSNNPADTKGGSDFVYYDFNFNEFGAFDLSQAYYLEGTFDLDETFDGKGISHISFFARDPAFASNMPEPMGLTLMGLGLGLAGFVIGRRR